MSRKKRKKSYRSQAWVLLSEPVKAWAMYGKLQFLIFIESKAIRHHS